MTTNTDTDADLAPLPFRTRSAAWYWGGGGLGRVIAEVPGGWYVLGVQTTPAAPEFFHVGVGNDGKPSASEGWPKAVKGKYVYASPEDGAQKTICRGEP
jgi:hypothetical protein